MFPDGPDSLANPDISSPQGLPWAKAGTAMTTTINAIINANRKNRNNASHCASPPFFLLLFASSVELYGVWCPVVMGAESYFSREILSRFVPVWILGAASRCREADGAISVGQYVPRHR